MPCFVSDQFDVKTPLPDFQAKGTGSDRMIHYIPAVIFGGLAGHRCGNGGGQIPGQLRPGLGQLKLEGIIIEGLKPLHRTAVIDIQFPLKPLGKLAKLIQPDDAAVPIRPPLAHILDIGDAFERIDKISGGNLPAFTVRKTGIIVKENPFFDADGIGKVIVTDLRHLFGQEGHQLAGSFEVMIFIERFKNLRGNAEGVNIGQIAAVQRLDFGKQRQADEHPVCLGGRAAFAAADKHRYGDCGRKSRINHDE